MPNTDPTAVAFANERIRPLADAFARLHKQAKEVAFLWQAKGLDKLIPNDATLIGDGSPDDGRTPITNGDANALIAVAAGFVAGNEANGNQVIGLVGKIAVNP